MIWTSKAIMKVDITYIIRSYNTILLLHSLEDEFEDTKWVIRIRKSKKGRQYNGQKKKYKQRSTKHTHKTKDRVTRNPLKH